MSPRLAAFGSALSTAGPQSPQTSLTVSIVLTRDFVSRKTFSVNLLRQEEKGGLAPTWVISDGSLVLGDQTCLLTTGARDMNPCILRNLRTILPAILGGRNPFLGSGRHESV